VAAKVNVFYYYFILFYYSTHTTHIKNKFFFFRSNAGIAEERSALAARMLGRDPTHCDSITHHDLRGFDVCLFNCVFIVVLLTYDVF